MIRGYSTETSADNNDQDGYPLINGVDPSRVRTRIDTISRIVDLWNHGDTSNPNSKPYRELDRRVEGIVPICTLSRYRSI